MGKLVNYVTPLHTATKRSYIDRMVDDKINCMIKAKEYEFDYWDGDRRYGYGGYKYDGRWVKVAQRAVKHFDLKPGDKVLDVGCAKGFFVNDLVNSCGIDAYGVDISTYALMNSIPNVSGRLHCQDMTNLLFPDSTFDAVFCINALHNLDKVGAFSAIQEFNRVVKNSQRILSHGKT